MTHDMIFSYFREQFPREVSRIVSWFPNGLNSIRIRYIDGHEFIFTYNKDSDWCYETVDCFIRRLKGELTMKC